LLTVPAGTTATYAQIARAVGAPNAVRAVGAANGANPVSLIVPCHRIIGSNGSLTGYGGGLDRKRWLLAHESSARQLSF
jgi:methylated-DNA-[protein]-cysteine S-methyltransferase